MGGSCQGTEVKTGFLGSQVTLDQAVTPRSYGGRKELSVKKEGKELLPLYTSQLTLTGQIM